MTEKRLFILDTNVLMHDPTALFRFHEHDVYLPMMVLEELDNAKKGTSEVARNVRQVSRFLDNLIKQDRNNDISKGILLNAEGFSSGGVLFFQTRLTHTDHLPQDLAGNKADNDILATALFLKNAQRNVTLVSKDINLRIKAFAIGLPAEDYYNDKVLDDADLLYNGELALPDDFWQTHSDQLKSWKQDDRTYYEVHGQFDDWLPNQFIYNQAEGFYAQVLDCQGDTAKWVSIRDYQHQKNSVWGITARNLEQSFALNLLNNPDIDFVSLLGHAGTGKTLLTLASALAQTLDEKRYQEIIMTRVTVPIGEDIGFLPGTEEEKMTPWMGALMDNLEVLNPDAFDGEWKRGATHDLLNKWIKVRSLNFMRGRTFLNRFVILDEAQNLTPKQMKTLITRAGPGTKIVCLGNIAQIDTPYLTETTCGLTYVVDRFKHWQHSGHMTLKTGERSRLADFASEIL
jgi:PhoH-like ATPase